MELDAELIAEGRGSIGLMFQPAIKKQLTDGQVPLLTSAQVEQAMEASAIAADADDRLVGIDGMDDDAAKQAAVAAMLDAYEDVVTGEKLSDLHKGQIRQHLVAARKEGVGVANTLPMDLLCHQVCKAHGTGLLDPSGVSLSRMLPMSQFWPRFGIEIEEGESVFGAASQLIATELGKGHYGSVHTVLAQVTNVRETRAFGRLRAARAGTQQQRTQEEQRTARLLQIAKEALHVHAASHKPINSWKESHRPKAAGTQPFMLASFEWVYSTSPHKSKAWTEYTAAKGDKVVGDPFYELSAAKAAELAIRVFDILHSEPEAGGVSLWDRAAASISDNISSGNIKAALNDLWDLAGEGYERLQELLGPDTNRYLYAVKQVKKFADCE